MFDLNSIGLRIKELRRNRHISQEQLAELIDVNFRTIQRIETGRNVPSLETLTRLAEAFNIEINDFFITEHLASREKILKDINETAQKLDDEKLRIFHKIIHGFYN